VGQLTISERDGIPLDVRLNIRLIRPDVMKVLGVLEAVGLPPNAITSQCKVFRVLTIGCIIIIAEQR
jgi:hypothetical protein